MTLGLFSLKVRDAEATSNNDINATQTDSKYVNDTQKLEQVRSILGESRFDDAAILRYLRATNNVHHAVKRLRETQEWRDQEHPECMHCIACAKDPHSHYMHPVAYALDKRPAIYSCLALAKNHNIQDNKVHMLSCFESAIAMMPPGVEQWIWIMDFHGFGIKDVDPRLAKIFLHISAAHYPERLAAVIAIDAPAVFSTLWRAVLPFIDPVTKQKIRFVSPHKETLKPLLLEFFDEDSTDWLVQEVAENRVKGVSKTKAYSFPQVARWAAAQGEDKGAVAEAASRIKASITGQHDYLGSPGMLKQLKGNNQLLLPQIRALKDND